MSTCHFSNCHFVNLFKLLRLAVNEGKDGEIVITKFEWKRKKNYNSQDNRLQHYFEKEKKRNRKILLFSCFNILSNGASDRIRTLYLLILSQMFYHFATRAQDLYLSLGLDTTTLLIGLYHPVDGITNPMNKLLCFLTAELFWQEKKALA